MTEKTLKGMPEELARSALLSEIEFLFCCNQIETVAVIYRIVQSL